MGAAKIEAARRLLAGGMPIKDVAATLEVGISTLYRYGLAGPAALPVGLRTDPTWSQPASLQSRAHRKCWYSGAYPRGAPDREHAGADPHSPISEIAHSEQRIFIRTRSWKAGDDRILRGNMRVAANRIRLVKGVQLSEFSVPNEYSIWTENAGSRENW
jgi:hypothetical protein